MEPFALPPGITVGEIPPFSPYNADQIERLRMQEAFRAEQAAREAARAARPSPFAVPKTFGEFFSPGTKAAFSSTVDALRRSGPALLDAGGKTLRVGGALAGPAAEMYRERDALFNEDSTAADRLAAGGRMLARGLPAAIGGISGGILGARTGLKNPRALGAATATGAIGGSLVGYKIGDEFLDLIGANTPEGESAALPSDSAGGQIAPSLPPPPAAATTTQVGPLPSLEPYNRFVDQTNLLLGFGGENAPRTNMMGQRIPNIPRRDIEILDAQPTSTLPARQRPAGGSVAPRPALAVDAPPAAAAPIDYNAGELFSPEAKAQIDKIAGRNEELSNLSKQYFASQGMREPRGLTTSDKLQILAKGLGTAALIAAFPGAGLLMALGGGLVGGAEEADNRRAANAAADQQDFTNTGTILEQQRKILADQMKADQDILGQTTEAFGARFNRNRAMNQDATEQRKLAEDARRFVLNYALRQRELSQRAALGQARIAALAANRGLLPAGTRPPNFNPLPSLDTVAKELMATAPSGSMTYAQARAQARQMINDELRGFGYATSGALPSATAVDPRDTMSDEEYTASY